MRDDLYIEKIVIHSNEWKIKKAISGCKNISPKSFSFKLVDYPDDKYARRRGESEYVVQQTVPAFTSPVKYSELCMITEKKKVQVEYNSPTKHTSKLWNRE